MPCFDHNESYSLDVSNGQDSTSLQEDQSNDNAPLHTMLRQSSRRLSSNSSFTVTIDILTVALVSSAVLYMVCFRLAQHKLKVLHRMQPQMTTKKLLILGVLLVSVLRIMTILGVAAMNMANVRAHYSLQPSRHSTGDKTQDFYDEAMTVLFDLPNCMVVSTYVLLTLVWAECFLESRFHTENAIYWKRRLLIFFMVFNTILYATQLVLYACIFFSGPNTVVRIVLYAAITGINFTAVLLVLSFYIYLNFRFSGFPYRNEELRQSLARVSSVMTLWSVTRVIWGIATLLVYIHNIELLQDSHTPVRSFVVMFVVFFVCEIAPIVVLLDYSYYMQTLIGGFLQPSTATTTTSTNDITLDENLVAAVGTSNNNNDFSLPNGRAEADHLLLTTPSHDPHGNRSRRVRFQEAAQVAEDPLLE